MFLKKNKYSAKIKIATGMGEYYMEEIVKMEIDYYKKLIAVIKKEQSN